MQKIFEDRKRVFFRVLNIIFVNTNLKKMKYRTSIVSEVIKNRRIRTKKYAFVTAVIITVFAI